MAEPAIQPEDDGKRIEDDARDDAELLMLKNAVTKLMEHFDSVQIFTTRFVSSDLGTQALHWGDGNWYARFGQIKNWVAKQDQGSRNEVE